MKSLRMHPIIFGTIVIVSFLFFGGIPFSDTAAQTPRSTTMYVKPSATGTGDCTSWDNACDLQTALTTTPPGEIWVAAGTYYPTDTTDRSFSFVMQTSLAIYGGFNGTELARDERDWETNATILSGNIGDPAIFTDNSYHVVTAVNVDNTAILDGFTITGGITNSFETNLHGPGITLKNANPIFSNLIISENKASTILGYGGGMYAEDSSPVLSNVKFLDNSAAQGGGLYIIGNSNATLTDVTFTENIANNGGGGMFCDSTSNLTNVAFNKNEAYGGGGFYGTANMTNATFTGNIAKIGGGAYLYTYNPAASSVLNLSQVEFIGNIVTYSAPGTGLGGGLYVEGTGGIFEELNLSDIVFLNNSAIDGGGLYAENIATTLSVVEFTENQAGTSGGGFYQNGGTSTLSDVDFSDNTATNGSGGGLYGGTNLTDVTFSNNSAGRDGGGKYGNSEHLTNVSFRNNMAAGKGGGMYGIVPYLTNVSFENNTATSDGGGMWGFGTLTDVVFSGNQAGSGGGLYGLGPQTLTRVRFSENHAGGNGGGLYGFGALSEVVFEKNTSGFEGGGMHTYNSTSMPSTLLENVSFIDNTANTHGGGLLCYYSGNFSLMGVTFSGNTATTGNGGGMWMKDAGSSTLITITNVTFSSNAAALNGGAISVQVLSLSSYAIQNTTITGNSASSSGGGIYLDVSYNGALRESILWGNAPDQIAYDHANNPAQNILETTNSIVQGGREGAGNLDLNPKLRPLADNGGSTQTHALILGSPAIDALDPAFCPAFDQRGVARPIDGDGDGIAKCDTGAYEAGEISQIYFPMLIK